MNVYMYFTVDVNFRNAYYVPEVHTQFIYQTAICAADHICASLLSEGNLIQRITSVPQHSLERQITQYTLILRHIEIYVVCLNAHR